MHTLVCGRTRKNIKLIEAATGTAIYLPPPFPRIFGYTPPGSRDGRPSVYVTDESSPLEDNGPMLYLSHGQKAIKETDMYDAIDRLRRMKSC